MPWVEKYRPRTITDVAHQDEVERTYFQPHSNHLTWLKVVSVLKKSLEGSDLPNLLFYGPPGTGWTLWWASKKVELSLQARPAPSWLRLGTSLARSTRTGFLSSMLLMREAFRFAEIYKCTWKAWSSTSVSGGKREGQELCTAHSRRKTTWWYWNPKKSNLTFIYIGVACPPYKIIILDEADSMTKDAQSALRRTMEKSGKSTKFCLICNYVSRIIEPITRWGFFYLSKAYFPILSRCAKFRFKPLAEGILIEVRLKKAQPVTSFPQRIELIMEKENVLVNEDGKKAIILTSEGDLR